jgi:hypothetical protein
LVGGHGAGQPYCPLGYRKIFHSGIIEESRDTAPVPSPTRSSDPVDNDPPNFYFLGRPFYSERGSLVLLGSVSYSLVLLGSVSSSLVLPVLLGPVWICLVLLKLFDSVGSCWPCWSYRLPTADYRVSSFWPLTILISFNPSLSRIHNQSCR